VSACARQIGAVLGISVLVAVLGTPAPAEALDAFDEAWLLMSLAGLVAAGLSAGLGRVQAGTVAEPATATA
jgi:hypothetical protein